jgi:ERCC4-type nuclease
MDMILDMANQNAQKALKISRHQKKKNKKYKKTQEQINEIIGALINTKVKQRSL